MILCHMIGTRGTGSARSIPLSTLHRSKKYCNVFVLVMDVTRKAWRFSRERHSCGRCPHYMYIWRFAWRDIANRTSQILKLLHDGILLALSCVRGKWMWKPIDRRIVNRFVLPRNRLKLISKLVNIYSKSNFETSDDNDLLGGDPPQTLQNQLVNSMRNYFNMFHETSIWHMEYMYILATSC